MKCDQVRQQLDDLAGGQLRGFGRWRVRLHVGRCAGCRDALRESITLHAHLHDWRDERAPQSLRERVMAAARAEGLVEPAAVAPPSRAWRRIALRALLVAAPATAVALLIFLPTGPTPAAELQRTLTAMQHVRSAHAIGTVTELMSAYRDVPPGPQRIELWYAAPDNYRQDIGGARSATEIPPASIVLAGQRGYYVSRRGVPRVRLMAPGAVLAQLLTLSIFSPHGAIEIAAAARGATLRTDLRREGATLLRRITLELRAAGTRELWVIDSDSQTGLVARAKYGLEALSGGIWVRAQSEVIERFDYDVPIPPGRFRPE